MLNVSCSAPTRRTFGRFLNRCDWRWGEIPIRWGLIAKAGTLKRLVVREWVAKVKAGRKPNRG